MFLQDGENGSVRPVRACKARLPKGSRCSLNAIDVLRPDSPQAQEYNARMAEKLLSQGSKGSVAPVAPPKKQSLAKLKDSIPNLALIFHRNDQFL